MEIQIICAGFGGQGILTAGKLLVHAAYENGLHLTWSPSYGNEMRGGTANCNVVISDRNIASPFAKHPLYSMILNQPSAENYAPKMKSGGTMFLNSTIINDSFDPQRNDIKLVRIPATELANNLGAKKSANIVMLGSMIRETGIFTKEKFINAMCHYFENSNKGMYNAKNIELFNAGYNYQG